MNLKLLLQHLLKSDVTDYDCNIVEGCLIVTMDENEHTKAIVNISCHQITVVCNFIKIDEVNPDKELEMLRIMNKMNIEISLSSFSQLGDYHIIFGALSVDSKIESIEEEINTLLSNYDDLLLEFEEFLI
jgi:uncharacterized protein YjfI (DUF2170 family)